MTALQPWQPRGVLVIGDLMLDEYVWGDVTRISPEAPVPVVHHRETTVRPGGAANVAVNIAALGGGEPQLVGVVGADADGSRLRHLLADLGVADHSLSTPDRVTTVKTRVMAHQQQLLRIDRESGGRLPASVLAALVDEVRAMAARTDCVVLSDYAKGVVVADVCRAVADACGGTGAAVIVDPKSPAFDKYRGATIITPNLDEARAAVRFLKRGDIDADGPIEDFGGFLADHYDTNVLITRGSAGMCLFSPSGAVAEIKPHATRSVFDVSGAGDTVVATLAVALANGWPLADAAAAANVAAGIVVTKLGAATVTLDELSAEYRVALGSAAATSTDW